MAGFAAHLVRAVFGHFSDLILAWPFCPLVCQGEGGRGRAASVSFFSCYFGLLSLPLSESAPDGPPKLPPFSLDKYRPSRFCMFLIDSVVGPHRFSQVPLDSQKPSEIAKGSHGFSYPGALSCLPKLLHFSFMQISTLTLLHVSHGFYQALSDSIRFFQIQILSDSDSIKFYQIQTPSGSIRLYQILSDFIRPYQILSDSDSTRFSFYQVLSDPIRFYQIQILASSDFIRFYQALSDSIRLYQTLSDQRTREWML